MTCKNKTFKSLKKKKDERNLLREQIMKYTFLVYPMLKKEVIKMLKELRKAFIRNADHWHKDLENIKRSQSKLDNQITKMKTELKTVNS